MTDASISQNLLDPNSFGGDSPSIPGETASADHMKSGSTTKGRRRSREKFAMPPYWVQDALPKDARGASAYWVYGAIVRCTYGDDRGAYPRLSMLVEMTGLSRRSVQRSIALLVEVGVVRVESRFEGGQQLSNSYKLLAEGVSPMAPPEARGGVTHGTPRVSPMTPRGVSPMAHQVLKTEDADETQTSARAASGRPEGATPWSTRDGAIPPRPDHLMMDWRGELERLERDDHPVLGADAVLAHYVQGLAERGKKLSDRDQQGIWSVIAKELESPGTGRTFLDVAQELIDAHDQEVLPRLKAHGSPKAYESFVRRYRSKRHQERRETASRAQEAASRAQESPGDPGRIEDTREAPAWLLDPSGRQDAPPALRLVSSPPPEPQMTPVDPAAEAELTAELDLGRPGSRVAGWRVVTSEGIERWDPADRSHVWALWERGYDEDTLLGLFETPRDAFDHLRQSLGKHVPVKIDDDRWDLWPYRPDGSVQTDDNYGAPLRLIRTEVRR